MIKQIIRGFLLIGILNSVYAQESIDPKKNYKGKKLELEGTLSGFVLDRKGMTINVQLPSVNDIKIYAKIEEPSGNGVDFDELQKVQKIRLTGICTDQVNFANNGATSIIHLRFNRPNWRPEGNPSVIIPVGSASEVKAAVSPVGYNENIISKTLVTVKGTNSKSSGFIGNYKGKKYLVTNIHVLFDSATEFTSSSGEKLEAANPSLVEDRDIAFFELANDNFLPALDIETDISNLEPEHPIMVFCNPLEEGISTKLPGKLMATGPVNIEVSAEIVPGNSGSPIVSLKTGKVVGLASFGIIRKPTFSTKGTVFDDARRFGLRMDTIKALQAYDKPKYEGDIKAYNTIVSMNELAVQILTDIYEVEAGRWAPTLRASKYDSKKYPSLQNVIKDWNDILTSRTGGKKTTNSIESVLTRFKSQISAPIASMKRATLNYKWVKEQTDKQIELNEYFCVVFDRIRKEVEELRRQN